MEPQTLTFLVKQICTLVTNIERFVNLENNIISGDYKNEVIEFRNFMEEYNKLVGHKVRLVFAFQMFPSLFKENTSLTKISQICSKRGLFRIEYMLENQDFRLATQFLTRVNAAIIELYELFPQLSNISHFPFEPKEFVPLVSDKRLQIEYLTTKILHLLSKNLGIEEEMEQLSYEVARFEQEFSKLRQDTNKWSILDFAVYYWPPKPTPPDTDPKPDKDRPVRKKSTKNSRIEKRKIEHEHS